MAAVEMHGRWRGEGDLAGKLGDTAKEHVFIERQRLQPLYFFRGKGRGELDLVAGVVAEYERVVLEGEAVGALDEAPPIGTAAEFAVAHHLEPDLLLHRNDVADAFVLQGREFGIADLLRGMAAEGLPQRGGAQQAADVIGAERRSALGGGTHAGGLPKNSIVQ